MSAIHLLNEPMGERPSHCEQCGEPPVNLQLYPLRPFGGAWICSRHPEYKQPAEYPKSNENERS